MNLFCKNKLLIYFLIGGFLFQTANVSADAKEATGMAAELALWQVTDETEPDSPTPSSAPTKEPTMAPTEEPTMAPTEEPTSTPTEEPTVEPTATPFPAEYALVAPKAKYAKSSQKGIKYHKVKGKKIYSITSYVTDTVSLRMSHDTEYTEYGGASKKEVNSKVITVAADGRVKCHSKKKDTDYAVLVQAKSKKTGECHYIYILFKKKLVATTKKVVLYERYKEKIRFNYSKSKLTFKMEKDTVASINGKGYVRGLHKGTTYLNIKVKGSVRNEVRIKVVVKVEPWIVNKNDSKYNYEEMTRDLKRIQQKYPTRARLSTLGQSYDKREIWCLRIGSVNASRKLIIDGAIHGREWKNSQFLTKQAEDLLRNYPDDKERYQNTCVYIVPMVNPDGVTISQYGYKKIRNKKYRALAKKLKHNKKWKSNARGVDLNNNFPAGWKKSKRYKKVAYMGYSGKKAGSEKETKIMMKLVKEVKPTAVLNFHSMGNVLYWDFNVTGEQHSKLEKLAKKIHSYNDYTLMDKTPSTNAMGGFADWVVYKQKKISITIETGGIQCPLPHSEFKSIWKKNYKMLRWFATKYK